MKRNFTVMAALLIGMTLQTTAQTSDNFNSRPGISTSQVKGFLQGNCWQFPDFDVNRNNWNPGIEGDGAMVSGTGSSQTENTGILTPLLDVPGEITISFSYKFNGGVGNGIRRWLKIYLTDVDNVPEGNALDSIEFTNINTSTVYTYNKKFSNVGSGTYRVYLNYQGQGGGTCIAIDQFKVSCAMLYTSGCNSAPVAANDNFTGTTNHQANGNVATNDHDPNSEPITSYLMTNSPDGTVTMLTDGSFSFMPNPGFSGTTTTFTYKVCDMGSPSLCSNTATVTLNFPAAGSTLPLSLTDLKGLYRENGNVELSWTTNFENNSDHFEVQRSLDGQSWETVGSLKAQGYSTVPKAYSFIDNAGRTTANRKDLYYRLKQVDLSTNSVYSKLLVVRVYNTRTLRMVSVTPNPAKNDISVNVQLNETALIAMKIINTNGTVTMTKTAKAEAGANTFLMDGTSKLSPGVYVLEVVINGKEHMTVKLIKD
jgi:hypothetical protein